MIRTKNSGVSVVAKMKSTETSCEFWKMKTSATIAIAIPA